MFVFCFFKQKTAYEMRISDWSSDVCSSDLGAHKIRALRCDSADAQALQMTITSAAGEHDGIEVLVNNAGAGVFRSIEELTLADFDQMVTINLRAVFVAIQAALPHMERGGRIIHLGSCNRSEERRVRKGCHKTGRYR